ncbi:MULTISPECIES: hypothetical protein [Nitrosomonas]|nr:MULTISPECIES: hypothetical protein [Nitrosomonas]MEB2331081.1 hypothetical protein [Nitrosomonas sp.]HNR11449.1 hypothetical protein [Nitrosomonas europaea]HRN81480.1 hypothetical protein [Nitrosomonas europaea]HRQ08511.1 hypothetical protein [Nitrosomonas europaea]
MRSPRHNPGDLENLSPADEASSINGRNAVMENGYLTPEYRNTT